MRTQKFQKSCQTFWSVGTSARRTHVWHACASGFGNSAGESVGNTVGIPSVIVAHSRNVFQLSVKYRRVIIRWWLGHTPIIVFQLSVKYRRVIIRRWCRRWLWHTPVIFFQLSVKYRRVISHRWLWHTPVIVFHLSVKYRRVIVRRWNRKFFLFFYVTVSQNLELQSYNTRNTITKVDH